MILVESPSLDAFKRQVDGHLVTHLVMDLAILGLWLDLLLKGLFQPK